MAHKKYKITLSEEELKTLAEITNSIGGSICTTRRRHSEFLREIAKSFVDIHECSNHTGSLYFLTDHHD